MHRHPAHLTWLWMALLATPLLATWEDGVAAYRDGRYDDAAAVFQTFVSSSPKAPEGHYMLGLTLLRQEKPLAALGPLGEALALGQEDLRYRLTLAQAQLMTSRPNAAFDTLAAQDPSTLEDASRAGFNKLLAKAAAASDRDDRAFDHLEKALAADGDSRALWLARANLAGRLDRPEDAFAALARAFELDPSDPKPGGAAAYAAMTIAQDPDTGDRKLEWYEKAAEVAGVLAAAHPSPENLRLAGSAAMGAKEYEKAFGYFERLLATEAQNPQLHYDLGRCRQALGDSREALGHFAAALERSPDAELTAGIHGQRGAALRVLEEFDDAAAAFRLAGDPEAAKEMAGYAKNRREWAAEKADCLEKRTGLEDILASSEGLENTPEYREVQRDLTTILSLCEPYFNEQG